MPGQSAAATVRQRILQRFPLGNRVREPDEALADSLYLMLGTVPIDVVVDGWALFRVIREAHDCLEAIGLMTLLPSGSVPLAARVSVHDAGLAWSARFGRDDDAWTALSDSKRWNSVYLHASGDLHEPLWTWGPTYKGVHVAQLPDAME